MAEFFGDISQATEVLKPTIVPQTITVTTNGAGIDVSKIVGGRMNALLEIGAVSGTTPTCDVKIQASTDNTTFVDVKDRDGNVVAFTQVTTADPNNQMLAFQLPTVTTATGSPYKYVRAVATLGGTTPSFAIACSIIALAKYDGAAGFQNVSPTIN